MKTLAPLFAVLLAASAPAFAGPCVALDYQEMKDMSADELAKEACKANKASSDSFDESIKYPSLSAASSEAMRDSEQCSGQVDRMLRILKSKGITEKLYVICEQQAKGKTIIAPADVK
jgi:hypothetical protein